LRERKEGLVGWARPEPRGVSAYGHKEKGKKLSNFSNTFIKSYPI
jgi:hypothetical protein